MDRDRLIFQIPIYRLSFDAWATDEEKRAAPYVKNISEYRSETNARILAQQLTRWQQWEYNEVIAWIDVRGFHDVIKAYVHLRRGERVHRHPIQPFEEAYKLTELWVNPEDSDERITTELRESIITSCRETPELKRRFVDMRVFDHLAPHLNWHAVISGAGH